jgi:hypothetical protein
MPTCTVERNGLGALASSNAALQRRARSGVFFVRQLLQARLARRDHGDLGHGENPVGDQKQKYYKNFKGDV